MRRVGLGLVFLVLSAAPVLANDTALRVSGGVVQMLTEGADVRMVSATITADVYADESRVRCEYELKNEGRGQTVTLGFPDMPGAIEEQVSLAHLEDFRSWVDGESLRVSVRSAPHEEGKGFDRWYVRRAWFDGGQTRHIVNTYTQPNGEVSIGDRWFPYTVWTASSWKGPIGQLTITVRWRELYLWALLEYSWDKLSDLGEPPDISLDRRTLTWSLRDMEPVRGRGGQLNVSFVPGWRTALVNGEDEADPELGTRFLVHSDFTMAPVRRVARLLGLKCIWADGVTTLSDDEGNVLVFQLGSTKAIGNNKVVTLRRAPMMWTAPGSSSHFARLYAPLRPICDAFGWQCTLDYEKFAVVFERAQP
jgi:hypothetical protein